MKPYMPVIVVLLILAALLGAGLVTAQMLKSPQSTFNEKVNPKIDVAQRLLYQYQGGQPVIVDALERLSKVKPVDPALAQPAGSQPTSAASPDEAPNTGGKNLLADRRAQLDQSMQKLKTEAEAKGGDARQPAPEFSTPEELSQRITANSDLLKKALDAVREGLQEPVTTEVMPNPVAHRLEAQILYQQADLLRREAKVQRVRADAERSAFDQVMLMWHQANDTVATYEQEMKGVNPNEPAKEAKKATPKPGGKPGQSLIGKFKGFVKKKASSVIPMPGQPAPAEPAPDATTPPSDNTNEQPAPTEPKPAEATPIVLVAVAPIEERVKQLETQGTEVDGKIAETKKEVERLSVAVKGLETDLASAKTKTDEAQKRMMELVNAGINPADSKALQKFVDAYNKAAEADRVATHEVTTLQQGLMRNAKPDAQEENEILTAPLVAKEAGEKVEAALGLTSLSADLKAAESLLESQQTLRAMIDAQIKMLKTRQTDLQKDLDTAKAWRENLAKAATARADAASKAADKAKALEDQALDTLKDAQTAAQAAATAVNDWTQKVGEFTRKSAAVGPQPQTGYMAGHATALEGDVELQRAWIYAQQAQGESQRQALLTRVPASQPATTQPAALVEENRKKAIEAGKAALEKFEKAAASLGGLWTLHTQMAAAHYLMASVQEGDEAAKERAAGLKEYQSATKDRGDAARDYRPMIQALSAQP